MSTVDPPATVERIAFLGTPAIAVPALRALLDAGYEVPVVITGPDRRRGRGRAVSFTPVKQLAVEHGLTVSSEVQSVLEHDVDLGVVVAFGQIIGPELLARLPFVNLHFSELPRWRGAAPVERAMLAGDSTIGVAVMQVAEGLDEGDIWSETIVSIDDDETASELKRRLAHVGADLLIETIEAGFPERRPQTGDPIYAKKISTDDRRLDWEEPAEHLQRVVRIGGAWTTFRGRRFKVHDVVGVEESLEPGVVAGDCVGTGSRALRLLVVQPEGRSRMRGSEWANGARADGERFES